MQELITHPLTLSLTPKVAFKTPSLKALGEFGSSEPELPILLAWHPANNAALSFTTTRGQWDGFAVTQVRGQSPGCGSSIGQGWAVTDKANVKSWPSWGRGRRGQLVLGL